jgi:hypothetical protein
VQKNRIKMGAKQVFYLIIPEAAAGREPPEPWPENNPKNQPNHHESLIIIN